MHRPRGGYGEEEGNSKKAGNRIAKISVRVLLVKLTESDLCRPYLVTAEKCLFAKLPCSVLKHSGTCAVTFCNSLCHLVDPVFEWS
jgi:hypothetical protein